MRRVPNRKTKQQFQHFPNAKINKRSTVVWALPSPLSPQMVVFPLGSWSNVSFQLAFPACPRCKSLNDLANAPCCSCCYCLNTWISLVLFFFDLTPLDLTLLDFISSLLTLTNEAQLINFHVQLLTHKVNSPKKKHKKNQEEKEKNLTILTQNSDTTHNIGCCGCGVLLWCLSVVQTVILSDWLNLCLIALLIKHTTNRSLTEWETEKEKERRDT